MAGIFSRGKLTKDEHMTLKKAFWEMIFTTAVCIEVYEFLKTYFRICTNINNYVPVRPWFDDENGEEQWECGYRDDMIAQFKQDLFNKKFFVQDEGRSDQIDTLQNRIKFWPNNIRNAQGPVPDKLYENDYNDEGLDNSVCSAKVFPETGELKNFLDILRIN